MPIKLSPNGIATFTRMSSFTPSQANLNPKKRIDRLRQLVHDQNPHICIVRGEGIGDVLMTTPSITALQKMFNGKAHITYATNTQYLDGALVKVLKYNPEINEVIDRQTIDESEFDVVASLHCPCLQYEKKENPPLNRVDLFARSLGFGHLDDPNIKYYIHEKEIEQGLELIHRLVHQPNMKFAMINIHSSSPRRGLEVDMIKRVVPRLFKQHGIVSLIPTHQSDFVQDIDWQAVEGAIHLKGFDVRQIASVMVHCDLLLCPDSALLHVGGALGVPMVTIFGPTDPRARINYFPNAVALWEGYRYAPCPCWFTPSCKLGYICMKMITEDMIVEKCVEHLSHTKKIDLQTLRIVK